MLWWCWHEPCSNALPITDTQACDSDSAMRHYGSRVRVWGSVLSGFAFGIHYSLCFTLTSTFLVIKLVVFDIVFPDLYPCNCKVDRWAGRTETSPIWRIEGGRLEHRLSSSSDEVRTPPPTMAERGRTVGNVTRDHPVMGCEHLSPVWRIDRCADTFVRTVHSVYI